MDTIARDDKLIIDTILELYIKNGSRIIDSWSITNAFYSEEHTKTLLQYSIECVLNVTNSRDIIFYDDNMRTLICGVAFLSNIELILGYGNGVNYLRKLDLPEKICMLVGNIFPIMAKHSRDAKYITCIQNIIDGLSDSVAECVNDDGIGEIIYKCMATRICTARINETEMYLYGYIKPILLMMLKSF